jgi:hypothetical protein
MVHPVVVGRVVSALSVRSHEERSDEDDTNHPEAKRGGQHRVPAGA